MRALRAELLPECAVPLVERHIARQRGEFDAELAETLIALHLASQARRMALKPPAYGGGDLDRYRAQRFRPWVERKGRVLAELAAHAKGMDPTGHAAATLAVARAIALRRLFDAARGVRVPRRVKERHDLRVKFYGAVDEELAALRGAVALADQEGARELSVEGTRRSDDADLWYRTTAPEYSRRLLLEASPAPRAETPRERVAARLPAFYAASLIDPGELGDVRLLRLLAEHGFTPGQRRALSGALRAEQREVLAEYRVAMARRTLDGVQWDEAVWLLSEPAQTSGRAQLLLATALAARSGPRSLVAALAVTPKPMDASPLVSFAESHHAPRLRALAMNNAAALTLPGGGADELDRVVRYGARAAELAPDEATRHCLWTLRETFVMRVPLPCALLKEP